MVDTDDSHTLYGTDLDDVINGMGGNDTSTAMVATTR